MIDYKKVFKTEFDKQEESKESFIVAGICIIGFAALVLVISKISAFIYKKRDEKRSKLNKKDENDIKKYSDLYNDSVKSSTNLIQSTLLTIQKDLELSYKKYYKKNSYTDKGNIVIGISSNKDIIKECKLFTSLKQMSQICDNLYVINRKCDDKTAEINFAFNMIYGYCDDIWKDKPDLNVEKYEYPMDYILNEIINPILKDINLSKYEIKNDKFELNIIKFSTENGSYGSIVTPLMFNVKYKR